MLTDFQNTFVRLAAERRFLDAFLADPETALAPCGLSPRERDALLGIPRPELVRYADSLLAKRSQEFARSVPWTLRICPSLRRRYRTWLAAHPAPRTDDVLDPGLREALRALVALRRELDDDLGEAPYAGDVFALEASASASRRDGVTRQIGARYRADRILSELEQGRIPMDPEPFPCRFRLGRDGVSWRPAAVL